MSVTEAPVEPLTPRPARRVVARCAGALVLLVTLAVGTWLVIGLSPNIGQGSYSTIDPAVDTETAEPDGQNTAIDPPDGQFNGIWTFTNDGPFPITVTIPATDAGDLTWSAVLVPDDRDTETPKTSMAEVSVAPGEEFAVAFTLGLGCSPIPPGTTVGTGDEVHLHVTTFGVGRTVTAHGRWSPAIEVRDTTYTPPASCPPVS